MKATEILNAVLYMNDVENQGTCVLSGDPDSFEEEIGRMFGENQDYTFMQPITPNLMLFDSYNGRLCGTDREIIEDGWIEIDKYNIVYLYKIDD